MLDLPLNRLGSGKLVFQSLISSRIHFYTGMTIYYQTVKTLNIINNIYKQNRWMHPGELL